ncbi:MAG TPA: flagellar protein FlgN [Noviherbaspirillum sp.]
MNNRPGSPADSLQEELKVATKLLELLSNEQDCLVSADAERLVVLSDEKAQLVMRMSELALRRHAALGAMGLSASESGMQAWLQEPQAQQAAGSTWKALLEIAGKAKELNRVNGLLIGQHMTRNQQALNILQGAPAAGAMYGPDGQNASATSTRRLVIG